MCRNGIFSPFCSVIFCRYSSIFTTMPRRVSKAPPLLRPSGPKNRTRTTGRWGKSCFSCRRQRSIAPISSSSNVISASVCRAVSRITPSKPVRAAKGANCAARRDKDIRGRVGETGRGLLIIWSYFLSIFHPLSSPVATDLTVTIPSGRTLLIVHTF